MMLGFWTAQWKNSWAWRRVQEEQVWGVAKFMMSTRHLRGEAKGAVG